MRRAKAVQRALRYYAWADDQIDDSGDEDLSPAPGRMNTEAYVCRRCGREEVVIGGERARKSGGVDGRPARRQKLPHVMNTHCSDGYGTSPLRNRTTSLWKGDSWIFPWMCDSWIRWRDGTPPPGRWGIRFESCSRSDGPFDEAPELEGGCEDTEEQEVGAMMARREIEEWMRGVYVGMVDSC